jgi:hypothetical protein
MLSLLAVSPAKHAETAVEVVMKKTISLASCIIRSLETSYAVQNFSQQVQHACSLSTVELKKDSNVPT